MASFQGIQTRRGEAGRQASWWRGAVARARAGHAPLRRRLRHLLQDGVAATFASPRLLDHVGLWRGVVLNRHDLLVEVHHVCTAVSAFPSSPSLPHSRPNTTVAAVRHSNRLRPPLAPPTSSEAPPRPPLPPHRSTAPRKPCIAATSLFPSSGSDRHRRRIHRHQRVPEPANHPCSSAVSH